MKLLTESAENKKLGTAIVVCVNKLTKKALIVQRGYSAPWMPGVWALVGGKVEEGEDARKAAAREVFEETQLKMMSLEFVRKHLDVEYGEQNFFWGYVDRDPVLNSENIAFTWVDEQGLLGYKYVPHCREYVWEILGRIGEKS